MICPCCGAETPDKNISEKLWNYSLFMEWFQSHLSYNDYKKYDIEHYHGRIKLKRSDCKNYKEILNQIVLFIDYDIKSNGQFPVRYAKIVAEDLQTIAGRFVIENMEWIKSLNVTDGLELVPMIKARFSDLVHWNNARFEFCVENSLKFNKLID